MDLTGKLKIGEENEICVVADNSQTPNSRWYTGSGIYRNVNLIVGDRRHVIPDGIVLHTLSAGSSGVEAELTVEVSPEAKECDVEISLFENRENGETAKAEIRDLTECPETDGEENRHIFRFTVPGAKLWDAEHPNLYTIRVCLMQDGELCDISEIRTGFRTLAWSAECGLQINGQTVKLRGCGAHVSTMITGSWVHVRLKRQNTGKSAC